MIHFRIYIYDVNTSKRWLVHALCYNHLPKNYYICLNTNLKRFVIYFDIYAQQEFRHIVSVNKVLAKG